MRGLHGAQRHNVASGGGTVWVTTATDEHGVVLTVENTGVELTPALVSTLAEPFRRGDERVRTDDSGVGLGLAIVQRITDAHGGALGLAPRVGGGLVATVGLPGAPSSA